MAAVIQAAKATAQLFVLAAVCLPVFANIPRTPLVAEKPHLGSVNFALASHRADSAANALIAPGIAGCLYDSGPRPCCSGKERDLETGLDYFGARYYSGAGARFTSPDPLMASARAWEPQSWNRYSYAFNNPLKYVDPNGMDVPKECIDNANCTIRISLNVIYDRRANFTDKQKAQFEKEFIAKAQKDYKNSNIELAATYSEGGYKQSEDGLYRFAGAQNDKLNVYFSNGTPSGKAGVAFNLPGGAAALIVDPTHMESLSLNVYPIGTNTLEHEIAHHLLGHTDQRRGPNDGYLGKENQVDWNVFRQSWGPSIPAFRAGTEKKIYAVPANPESVKPRK